MILNPPKERFLGYQDESVLIKENTSSNFRGETFVDRDRQGTFSQYVPLPPAETEIDEVESRNRVDLQFSSLGKK